MALSSHSMQMLEPWRGKRIGWWTRVLLLLGHRLMLAKSWLRRRRELSCVPGRHAHLLLRLHWWRLRRCWLCSVAGRHAHLLCLLTGLRCAFQIREPFKIKSVRWSFDRCGFAVSDRPLCMLNIGLMCHKFLPVPSAGPLTPWRWCICLCMPRL